MNKHMMLVPIFCFGLLVAAVPVKADTLTLRGDDWCPYNCDPTAANAGYIIEIAKEVFEKAGHKIDYQLLPWARTLEKVKVGEFTAAVGAAKDDEPSLVYGNEMMGVSSNVFGVRKDDAFEFKDVSSLESKSLGVIHGYAYISEIDAYIEKNKKDSKRIQAASGDDALATNINKMVAGRVDLVVEDENVLLSKFAEMKVNDKVRVVKSTLSSSNIYLAFSPANPKSAEYAALLDKGVAEMRSSGKLAEILAKYGLKDWK